MIKHKIILLVFILLLVLPFVYAGKNDGENCVDDYDCGAINCASSSTIEYPICDIGINILAGVPGRCTSKLEACPENTACKEGKCIPLSIFTTCKTPQTPDQYDTKEECENVCRGNGFCSESYKTGANYQIQKCWYCGRSKIFDENGTAYSCEQGEYKLIEECNKDCFNPPCNAIEKLRAKNQFFSLTCYQCPSLIENLTLVGIEDNTGKIDECPNDLKGYAACYQSCTKNGLGICEQSKEYKGCYSCAKLCPKGNYNNYQSCYESCTKVSNGQSYCKPSKENQGCYSCEKFNQGVVVYSDNKVSCQGQVDNYLGKISIGENIDLPLNIHFDLNEFGIKTGDYRVLGIEQKHFYLDSSSIKLNGVNTENNIGNIKIKSFNNLWNDVRNACPDKVAIISALSKHIQIKYNPPKKVNQILPGILIDKKTQIGLLLPRFISVDKQVKIFSVNNHKNNVDLLSLNPINTLGSLSSNLLSVVLQSNPRQATQARSYVMGQAFNSFTFGFSGTLEANI
ncbi:hypothetical protein J4216_02755 [Candidatus Woesearchaeota archaeon]|nr:hypothetical protein [Candidatus Woesearchaeota archaeon]